MQIQDLLKLSVEQRASDLHLLPGFIPLLRIDGTLTPIKNMPVISPEEMEALVYSIMTEAQQKIFEKNLVLELPLAIDKVGNFRASLFHQLHGLAAVFRVIPSNIPTLDELELPSIVKALLNLSHGIILVTGPTGCGKSTTLAAMIDYINIHKSYHIITIEDPIEFMYTHKKSVFNQLQVGRDTVNFASALRASLRQDPNVILLGELRDLETMRLALTAAETGHLVLATLHAASAPIAINRFADVFPSEEKNRVRSLLSETLQAVICQALVKKIGGGRAAAFEVMLATQPIRHFIRQDMVAHMESTMQTSREKGMCTLEHYMQEMVAKGIITSKTAENALMHRSAFKNIEKI